MKAIKKIGIIIIVILALLIVVGLIGGNSTKKDNDKKTGNDTTETATQNSEQKSADSESSAQAESSEATTEHYETDLTAGLYTAGKDIPAGTYNITATSGSGNVNSSNLYNGGLNEVMGTPADEYTQETFNGAQLEDGVVLSVGGTVSLHIVSENALVSSVVPRSAADTTPIDLQAGNYVAGTDFPAGTYNVIATGGSGNVNSSNLYDGGINEVFNTENDGFSIQKFSNVQLPENTTLSVSGTSIQLVPAGE